MDNSCSEINLAMTREISELRQQNYNLKEQQNELFASFVKYTAEYKLKMQQQCQKIVDGVMEVKEFEVDLLRKLLSRRKDSKVSLLEELKKERNEKKELKSELVNSFEVLTLRIGKRAATKKKKQLVEEKAADGETVEEEEKEVETKKGRKKKKN